MTTRHLIAGKMVRLGDGVALYGAGVHWLVGPRTPRRQFNAAWVLTVEDYQKEKAHCSNRSWVYIYECCLSNLARCALLDPSLRKCLGRPDSCA